MKKSVAITILIVAVFELCISITSFVYAFFVTTKEASPTTIYVSDSAANTVAAVTETNLVEQSRDTSFVSGEIISDVTSTDRKTIKFSNDITLTDDLIITADCHINLNGFTLYLNGHTLTISHNYKGTFVISNGTIETTSAADQIYIDTPNAIVVTDVTIKASGVTQTKSDYVTVLEYDSKWLAYNIFYSVAKTLADEYDQTLERKTYEEINTYFTLDEDSDGNPDNTDFSELEFLPAHSNCTHHGAAAAPFNCAYVNTNIDLFTDYFGYDAVISYASSSESVLSNTGRVNPTNNVETLTLTVTIKQSPTDNTVIGQKSFNIHVIKTTNSAAWAEVTKNYVLDYLKLRYEHVDTDNDDVLDWWGYVVKGELQLPATIAGINATIAYETYDGAATPVLLDSTANLNDGATTVGHFSQSVSNVFVLAIDSSVKNLKYTVTVNGVTSTSDYLPVRGDSTVVKDNYTIAQSIIREWYGTELSITNATSGAENALNNYTTKTLYTDVSGYTDQGVTAVTYSLVNNTDETYALGDSGTNKLLYVVAGQNPDQLQTVFVKATFNFGSDVVQITLPVVYSPDSGSGNSQVHPFLPYYTYFNRVFMTATGNNTYKTFEMPFNYSTKFPAICFDITGDTDGAITTVLYYNGTEHTLSLGANTSMTQSLDTLLSSESKTLQDVINYGDAKWIFKIDIDKLPKLDREITMEYNYKFANTENSWTAYSKYSIFTLTGILRCVMKDSSTVDSTGMPDTVLYKWVYDNFNPYDDTYTYTNDKTTKYVLTSWLTKDVTFSNTNNSIAVSGTAIANYKGIEYLDGTKTVLLNNNSASTAALLSAMQYLAGMESLETLNLSNSGLYDSTGDSWGFPNDDDNGFLNTLSASTSIKTLDLSNNKIYSFEYLENFSALEKVYTYGNTFTANTGWSGLDDVLSGIINGTYGSAGSNNINVYQRLYTEKGVKVYYQNANNYFTGGSGLSDYDKLACIEYQDILPAGVPITVCYEHLSTDPADYGITNVASNSVQNISITFSYSGSNASTSTMFTITYSYQTRYYSDSWLGTTSDWATVVVKVNFNVERLD